MWNEEKRVENSYNKLYEYISQSDLDIQIVFATNGCTDKTVDIIKKLKKKDSYLIHYDYPESIGKGKAIQQAFEMVQTPYVIFMDCDIATDLKHVPEVIEHLENGADVVIGSRKLKDSECKRGFKRRIFSTFYNSMVRTLFRSKLRDHQCGFKGFRRESFLTSLNDIESSGWFWDTEILIKAQRRNLKVVEIPVHWEDLDEQWSKFNLLGDTKKMAINLIRFRWKLFAPWFQQLIKFLVVGVSNTLVSIFILWLLDFTIGRGFWGYPFAYLIGTTNSFILNKLFTFKKKRFTKITIFRYFIYLGLGIIAGTIYSLIAIFLEVIMGLNYVYASFGGTIIHFMVQFVFYKFIVFKMKVKKWE